MLLAVPMPMEYGLEPADDAWTMVVGMAVSVSVAMIVVVPITMVVAVLIVMVVAVPRFVIMGSVVTMVTILGVGLKL